MSALLSHLHVHSHYSLLRALPKIKDLVKAAKAQGASTLALTDIDNLYGTIEFVKECKDAELKPIIGLDAHVSESEHILLWAENEVGYRNLLKIVTDSHLKMEDGRPFVSRELLLKYREGLMAHAPRATDTTHKEYAQIFVEKDGKRNYFPKIAAKEAYYLKASDRRAWETMRAIENKGALDVGDIAADNQDYFLLSQQELAEEFENDAEAVAATQEIAERASVDLVLGKFVFPHFELPEGKTADQVLRELCMLGLTARGLEGRDDVMERLNYELGIIEFKGYAAYFLVVEDLIRFARENNIYTNIRGSVAGSMTTYLLRITKIDPLEYKIPFERFLNPERPSAPDIDMDFADDRRDEVIDYARQKYGDDHVAQIGTFGTMLARGVVRDVARALGLPYGLGDRIAKEIPMGSQGFPMTLDRALEENPELKKIYDNEEEVKEIIDLGKIIEGCARHVGVHAAGVVISPKKMIEYAPLQLDPKGGKIITQYDMYSVGEDGVGLTKFDFLGIRNLTILANAVDLVNKTRNINLDIETIPLDDKKTYDMLTHGDTEATFQLNGAGMTRFLKELQPTSIHDINAMVALYRPGPMQFIPQYIERKHEPRLITYLDPSMEPILKTTFGILVYQDDLLIMAHDLAGYSWGEVDKFRKAVGKKIPEEMAKQKEKFIEGCVATSKWSRKKAEEVWAWIEPFAAYGFNKAHAASYGRVSYQTAYMKANFPVEYMTAVLTAEAGDIDTVSIMVAECKRIGIPVLPPDVNESFGDFTVVRGGPAEEPSDVAGSATGSSFGHKSVEGNVADGGGLPSDGEATSGDFVATKSPYPESASVAERGAIRFGLYSIKNFGTGVADSIIEERKVGGKFTSISNFLSRVKDQGLNKKGLESLIKCGALDSFGERGAMLSHIEQMLEYHRELSKEQMADSLFGGGEMTAANIKIPDAPPASQQERLAWEKELLGLYVSGHPLDRYREQLDKRPMTINQMKEKIRPGTENVVAAGMLESVRTILTQKGDQMAFIKIADYDGAIEAVVFPKNFVEFKKILIPETVIALKGKLSERNGELSMVAEKLKAL